MISIKHVSKHEHGEYWVSKRDRMQTLENEGQADELTFCFDITCTAFPDQLRLNKLGRDDRTYLNITL